MVFVLAKLVSKKKKKTAFHFPQHKTANRDRIRHVVDISGLVVYIEECGPSV